MRPLLSTAEPEYCGISYLELDLTDVVERHPDPAALVGPGILFALSDHKGADRTWRPPRVRAELVLGQGVIVSGRPSPR